MPTNPTGRRPGHHLSITDGTNTVNLLTATRQGVISSTGWGKANNPKSALRINQGNSGYGDFELPFSSIVQSDWSGGRGLRDLEKDSTRFADSLRCDTRKPAEARMGPLATQGSGHYTSLSSGATATTDYMDAPAPDGDPTSWASSITTVAAATVRGITFYTKQTASTRYDIRIYTDSGSDSPNTLAGENSIVVMGAKTTEEAIYASLPAIALSATTKYWVEIDPWGYNAADSNDNIAYQTGVTGKRIMRSGLGGSWSEDTNPGALRFTLWTIGGGTTHFFHYRGMTMAVTSADDQSAPRLYVQGYHGMATSNAADKSLLNSAAVTFTADELIGCYVRIIAGDGSTEETPWRLITNNSTTTITVSPSWNITHSANTEFVVLGTSKWVQVTDTETGTYTAMKNWADYMTAPVTDVLVVDDIIYFAMGESVRMTAARFNTGVWSDMAQEASGSKYNYLALVQDDKGTKRVWAAAASAATVVEASKVAWGASLSFNANPIVCQDTSSRITNLIAAKVSGPMLPVVFKETCFGAVSGVATGKIFDSYRDFPEAKDDYNGRAAIQHDLYLWFSLMDGLERYYDQRLDDVGPNRDEGLPATRKGRVSSMLEYFNRIYAAVDAGHYGYSCILEYNGTGWHEMYRGGYGQRIRSLGLQVIPDLDSPDRLWFSEEEDLNWIPVALNPSQQTGYTYHSTSELETAWIYGPFKDLPNFWSSLTLYTEGLTSARTIVAYYKKDADTSWTLIGSNSALYTFTTSPVQEQLLGLYNVTGRRIKFKLVFSTNSSSVSPVLYAMRVNAVVRVKPKAVWSVTALVSDGKSPDLNGTLSDTDAKTYVDRLEAWQDGASYTSPLTLSFLHSFGDAKRGFVDSVSSAPIQLNRYPEGRNLAVLVGFNFIEV
jgi:hypothetical protein